jgi:hypothetical protein
MTQFLKDLLGKGLNRLSITHVIKTVDPRYHDVKRQLSSLSMRPERLIGALFNCERSCKFCPARGAREGVLPGRRALCAGAAGFLPDWLPGV